MATSRRKSAARPRARKALTRSHHQPRPITPERSLHLPRRKKSAFERGADWLTGFFGTLTFLIANMLFFVFWLAWNTGSIPGLPIVDPFPFSFLTTGVSLEAIMLSIIVLISQNRDSKIAKIQEEIDVRVDIQSERQISEMVRSLDKIMHALSVSHHEEPSSMKAIDLERLERRVIDEIDTD